MGQLIKITNRVEQTENCSCHQALMTHDYVLNILIKLVPKTGWYALPAKQIMINSFNLDWAIIPHKWINLKTFSGILATSCLLY
jgi:hypothetical protein